MMGRCAESDTLRGGHQAVLRDSSQERTAPATSASHPTPSPAAPGGAAGTQPNRRAPRVAGPFEARRLGAVDLPLRIHDLSLSGCLIESYQEVTAGRRIELEIELP